ncbi:hypothetical protein KZZ52_17365 [Dactylosporangium sp. AC04546]|uniref:hypothetical protein n=1 Tax=Dactylosporangium sp. AC04546 TaxID=2862460 RepID=UPI001EDECEAA|nr:hypothetical protein [Dactylosporangium sp. AC04546]WVK87068.1 hypothetical protein KZZ52_17365 [Dactylosporangium sp. AC04546]
MDNVPHADRADVRETDDSSTLILSANGLHVVMIRLRYGGTRGEVDEVINSAGEVATGAVGAWTLIGQMLSLELDRRAAAKLGFPRDYWVRLDLPAEGISLVRASLLEILYTACFVVDTPEGRVTS